MHAGNKCPRDIKAKAVDTIEYLASRPYVQGYDYMDETQDWEIEAEKLIAETLGSLEATVDQLEALPQMSEELEGSLEDMRSWLAQVNLFLSSRFRVALIAATIIIGASLVGYIRGWWQARRLTL